APLPRRRVAGRRLAAALVPVVGDDDLVVPAVEEHAVRIAEAGFRTADRSQRLRASFGALRVDDDLARRLDRDRELVPFFADRDAPGLVRHVEHALRLDVAVRLV